MTPEEKKLHDEKEAAEKAAADRAADAKAADKKAKSVDAEEAAFKAALEKLTAEQARLAKEQADLHAKFAADRAKHVKVEDLPELLITSPENEWRDREKLLKDQNKK